MQNAYLTFFSRSLKTCRQSSTIRASSRKKLPRKRFLSDTETLPAGAFHRRPTTVGRLSRSPIPAAMRMLRLRHVSKRTHHRMSHGRCRVQSATFKVQWRASLSMLVVHRQTLDLHRPTPTESVVSATVANRILFNPKEELSRCRTEPVKGQGPWVLPVNRYILA